MARAARASVWDRGAGGRLSCRSVAWLRPANLAGRQTAEQHRVRAREAQVQTAWQRAARGVFVRESGGRARSFRARREKASLLGSEGGIAREPGGPLQS